MKEIPPASSGQLLSRYFALTGNAHFRTDPEQIKAAQKLQDLLDQLAAQQSYQAKSLWQKWLAAPPAKPKSLYLHGKVGRGKSLLLALFYHVCTLSKRRVHFHAFMQEAHSFIKQAQINKTDDVIGKLAENIKAKSEVICFDEFQVTDIVDAMLLSRLFRKLFERGVVVVITSNIHPSDLYLGGLQRELFLPFIDLLRAHADIVELNSIQDYRLNRSDNAKTYFYPLGESADAFIKDRFQQLTGTTQPVPFTLEILGRTLTLNAVGDVLLASFQELCGKPLGAADYITIAYQFKTIILKDIPKLYASNRNEAKRFIKLIDVLYEHKTKLICSAEAAPQSLYNRTQGAVEFERTASRLEEMQSERYWNGE